MVTSRGRVAWIAGILALTRSTTSLEFSPLSMITMPATASPCPSRVTAPCRVWAPTCTWATSRSSTGVPSLARSTISSMSWRPRISPTLRT